MTNAIVEFLTVLEQQHQLLREAVKHDFKVCWDDCSGKLDAFAIKFDSLLSDVPSRVDLCEDVLPEAFTKAVSEVRDAGPLAEKLYTALVKARDAHVNCFDAAYDAVEERRLSILMHAIDDCCHAMGKVCDLLPAVTQPSKRKRLGRRRKEESSADMTIIAALNAMHEQHGQDEPPSGKEIKDFSKIANVSRFMNKHFGGQKQFEGAWRRGTVSAKLGALELKPERHAEIYEGDGRRTAGIRHAGRTPGT